MRWTLALMVAALGAWSADARAHGQFPLPLGTLPDPHGQDPLAIVTFGALLPTDDGPGYRWICEEIAGGALTSAVVWARTSEGTLLGGGREGLFRFTRDLCGVNRPTGIAASERVRSLGIHPELPIVVAGMADGSIRTSSDDALTFGASMHQRTGGSPVSILVSGTADALDVLVLWRHIGDGYAALQHIRGGVAEEPVVISDPLAIAWEISGRDSQDSNRLYVRENGPEHDRILLVSAVDASVTRVLLEADDELAVGAASSGGWVAMGGLTTALQVSSDHAETFTTVDTLSQVRGITINAAGRIYAAANNWQDGFAFGFSDDQGATWTGLGRFVDIRGVQQCETPEPAEIDVITTCGPYWPALKDLFGIGVDAGQPPEPTDGGTGGGDKPVDGCPDFGGTFLLAFAAVIRRASPRTARSSDADPDAGG